jgi:hypothetical protein
MATLLHRAVAAKIGGKLTLMDAIEHDGETLVVVLWYGKETEGLRWPEYVIPLASVRHRVLDQPTDPYRYFLTDPLPADLFLGTATRQRRKHFSVLKGPKVMFPIMQ